MRIIKIIVFFGLVYGLAIFFNPFPVPSTVADLISAESHKVYSREGELLRQTLSDSGGRNQNVHLDEVSPQFLDLLVHVEDKNFKYHVGVDPLAVLRAFGQFIKQGKIVSGASTITMQLSRLMLNLPRTMTSKLYEAALALYLEMSLSKDKILELYINHMPFSNQVYGLKQASLVYFNKDPRDITLAQSAYLLGIIRAPSYYNPYLRHLEIDALKTKILKTYFFDKDLSGFDVKSALLETIDVAPLKHRFEAPHFTDMVLRRFGLNKYVHKTSLDLKWQKKVEEVLVTHLKNLADKNVNQASVLVVDNQSGEVLVYAGSVNYWNDYSQGMIDGLWQNRQPGSTLKPFTYARALDLGIPLTHTLPDVKTLFQSSVGQYIPDNYDHKYRGPVMLRTALANSLNIPAIHMLKNIGVVELYQILKKLKFKSLTELPAYYGLGLTLGNVETNLWELVRAYSVFARSGQFCNLTVYRRSEGYDCLAHEKNKVSIFSGEAVYKVRDVLSDSMAREMAFGRYGPLEFDYPVMIKTGTSQGYRDNWTVAVTPRYTVGVWVGNFNGDPMQQVSGVTGAGAITHSIVSYIHKKDPWVSWGQKILEEKQKVCAVSGQSPGPYCEHTKWEYVGSEYDSKVCDVHQQIKVDRRNGLLAGPLCLDRDVNYKIVLDLPERYVEWQMEYAQDSLRPVEYSPYCNDAQMKNMDVVAVKSLRILRPQQGAIYKIDQHRPLNAQTLGLKLSPSTKDFNIVLDDIVISKAKSQNMVLKRGKHTLKVVSLDGLHVWDQVSYIVR